MACYICEKEIKTDERKGDLTLCCDCQRKIAIMKQFKMLEKAINALRRKGSHRYWQAARNDFYKNEYELIKKKIEAGEKFDSKEEIVVALQLEKEKIKHTAHYKVGAYTVDFLLADMKVALEIDGSLYHSDESKEFFRERAIIKGLGEDWDIVRVSADLIPRYITEGISEAIGYVLQGRKDAKMFRDTRNDQLFLEEFRLFKIHMRRNS